MSSEDSNPPGGAGDSHRQSLHPHPDAEHDADRLDAGRRRGKTTDKEEAASLLRQAPRLLKEVQDCYLLQHHKRSYPTFHKSEVTVGPLLGVGGFGVVFEVENLTLLPETEDVCQKPSGHEDGSNQPVAKPEKPADGEDSKAPHRRKSSEVSFQIPGGGKIVGDADAEGMAGEGPEQDDSHYDVENARKHMAQFVRRDGEARYAIKRLHKNLPEVARARGILDLAMEATFLSGLWHPNIVKMRAVSDGDFLNRHFFIIMDRLYDTLDKRIHQWKERYSKCKGNLFGFGVDKKGIYQLNVERLIVAYDLAAALSYMHANKIIYRDLKQQNIAFDIRGDVKVFDFGLSKSVSEALRAKDSAGNPLDGYNLTPRTGSIPYMAPEIVECKPYDEKCDVFSFAILLWEIFSMRKAFKGYTRRDFLLRVVRQKERPNRKDRSWPICVPMVLKEAWEDDPKNRPFMKRVATLIRGDLNELCTEDSVTHRSMHLRNRSAHSAHLRMLLENGIGDVLNDDDDDDE